MQWLVSLDRRRREVRDWRQSRGHGKTEAEAGLMQPQAKGRLEPPEGGGSRRDPPGDFQPPEL